MCTNSKETRNG